MVAGTKRRRTGRPRGFPPNREAILAASRQLFVERGYERATIRSIATKAGIDPALVLHYFGSKERLFLTALTDEFRPEADEFARDQLGANLEGLGERLVRRSLEAWFTSPSIMPAVVEFLAVASQTAPTAAYLREVLFEGGIFRLISALGLGEPKLRTALIGATLFGLALARFVVRLEPIADADLETLVACYAPVVQHFLTMPVGPPK
jgi:AcrR family transcriptional regulator